MPSSELMLKYNLYKLMQFGHTSQKDTNQEGSMYRMDSASKRLPPNRIKVLLQSVSQGLQAPRSKQYRSLDDHSRAHWPVIN